jgi:hypothetical protein
VSSTVTPLAPETPEPAPEIVEPPRRIRSRRWAPDALVAAAFLGAAVFVTYGLWRGDGVLRENRDDPIFFQWMLTHAARIFTHGENPFFAEQINAPFGLNLMANTSALGWAIPLAPVTILFGPWISFLVMLTAGLAGTAFAWYFVLSRHLVRNRAAAIIGGAFCGFAPGMISHANGHPNIVSQFLVPFLVLAVLRLRRDPDRWRRNGLILAGLVIYQTFINEEVLFLTALIMIVFVVLWAVQRRAEARPLVVPTLKAAGLCLAVAGAVLAYPLYWQFFGTSAYHGLPLGVQGMGTDLLAVKSYSYESVLGGTHATVSKLASSGSEENTFFGVPLLYVLLGVAVVLVRSAAGRALMLTLAWFWWLSLGPYVLIRGEATGIRTPWYYIAELPLFNSVVPTRIGLALTPIIGVLLALAVDRFQPVRFRVLWTSIVIAALLPIAPTPLDTSAPHVPPTPIFFTSGAWRDVVPEDGVVLSTPPGWVPYLSAMSWQVDTNLDFNIVGGYYLAPTPGDPTRRANFGPAYPPTMRLLWYVGEGGADALITDEHRRQAVKDFREYKVTTLVLPVAQHRSDLVKNTVRQLIGEPRLIEDCWVWDVRRFVATGVPS